MKDKFIKGILFALGIIVLLSIPELCITGEWRKFFLLTQDPRIQTFSIVFLSILLEAFPFILIGALISGVIETFVSKDRLRKLIPKNKFLSLFVAAILGIIFPVCECGVIVVVKRLIKKGLPLYTAITYMLAAPIINPIVIASTTVAFRGTTIIIFGRIILAFIIAVSIGYIVSFLKSKEALKNNLHSILDANCVGGVITNCSFSLRLTEALNHAITDFFDIGKYLIAGSFVAAITQSFIPKQMLLAMGSNSVISILVMMGLAIVLSLCSEADAFVANTFTQFTVSSKLAFLVLGPMFDLKLLFMFLGIFKKRLVLLLVTMICVLVFLLTLLVGYLVA